MGGAAGSGGSDNSDERKVDTYANQLKKIQKKKSKTERNEFGYTVPKKKSFVPPSVAIVKGVFGNQIDKLNLNRRMKFANKNNINLQGLSTEQILSKDFKSTLDAKGYTRETPTGNNNGGNDNRTILSTAPVRNVTAEAPTSMEVAQAQSTNSTEYSSSEKKIKTNKKGRTDNILTASTGLGNNNLVIKKNKLGAA